MLSSETKRRIDTARDILVGKIPDPKSQIEQITIALIYKFMDDMDKKSEELGGRAKFFTKNYEKYSWSKLLDASVSGSELVNNYSEAIISMNQNPNLPQLFRDIFKNALLPYRDPETLRSFLRVIGDFKYDHSEELGDAFEYLLSVMGSQGDAGQFRTPRHIIDFIVNVVDPQINDTILDPACGTAGFLISAYKHILEKNTKDGRLDLTPYKKKKLADNIVGYDISPDMVKLSLVNLYLHKFKAPKIYEYDTLTYDERWDDTFDVCLANPPFMTPTGGIKPHGRFGVKSNRAEVLFVDYMHEHMNSDGKAGIVVPEGIVFQSGNAYKQLRKTLVENSLYAVVSLPAGVFKPYSGVKTSILILDKKKCKESDEILFLKIENDGYDLGAQRREIDKNDLPEALVVFKEWKEGKKRRSKIALWVKKEKIAENEGYDLTGERYREVEDFKSVKYPMVELGKICDIRRGQSITKKQTRDGNVPVIAGGQKPAYYHNESNRTGKVITISGSGAYAGFVNFFDAKIFASDCTTIQEKEQRADIKYIYYTLRSMQAKIYSLRSGMAQPHIYPKDIQKIKIPLPPIEVQRKISEQIEVKQNAINHAREIIKSLERERRYFGEEVKKLENVEWVELEEIAEIGSGNSAPQNKSFFERGKHPFCRTSDVGKIHFSANFKEIKDRLNDRGIYGLKLYKKNTILFPKSGASTFLNHRVILGIDSYVSSHLATIYPNEKKIIPKFLFNLLCFVDAKNLTNQQAYPSLKLSIIKKIKIPLPSLEIQTQFVAEIEREEEIKKQNELLIEIFERKIKDKIAQI